MEVGSEGIIRRERRERDKSICFYSQHPCEETVWILHRGLVISLQLDPKVPLIKDPEI